MRNVNHQETRFKHRLTDEKLLTLLSQPALSSWKLTHLSRICSGDSFSSSSTFSPSRRRATRPGTFCRVMPSKRKRWKMMMVFKKNLEIEGVSAMARKFRGKKDTVTCL